MQLIRRKNAVIWKQWIYKILLVSAISLFIIFAMSCKGESGKGAAQNTLYGKTISLPGEEDEYILKIYESSNGTLTLELYYDEDTLQKAMTIGNAATKDEMIQKVNLDGEGENEYFITAYDRSSTYGAQTNIIIWERRLWWNMTCAPFERGFAEDRNKDGIYEIIEYYPEEKVYNFCNGLFIEQK